ncbi:Uncharacterised protein [Serratia grimesii]|nr:hypothetical protein 348p1_00097 [Serratia grimesii]CAI2793932.1 Uncharacterised protein [Serratia grimesii]
MVAEWLWHQRQNAPPNADIWDVRWRWLIQGESERLYRQSPPGNTGSLRWRYTDAERTPGPCGLPPIP